MKIRHWGGATSGRNVVRPRPMRTTHHRHGALRDVHRYQREQGNRRRAGMPEDGHERAVVEYAAHDNS